MKKTYFASDFHLGAPNEETSKLREIRLLKWLDFLKKDGDCEQLFLVGDIFDFWFEYKTAIPKGYTRFLGKLAELSDAGVKLHIFSGNHDVWMFDYFEKELGAKVYHEPQQFKIGNKLFFVGHGDGLGPKDRGYKFIKSIFRNRFCQWLFRWLHPDIGTRLATFFSNSSRESQKGHKPFMGKTKEWLVLYSLRKLKQFPEVDYFIFGHRHLAQDILFENDRTHYVNLGDWFSYDSYAVFDGEELKLCRFGGEDIGVERYVDLD